MSDPDLVLLHAPSVYDFRQEVILYGPIADFVCAPIVFEARPLGYVSLAQCLERDGFRVHTVNLARLMLDDPEYDAEAAIAALNPVAFVIDAHWLVHTQGVLAVAQIVKTFHPETPIILVGGTATYFHRELVNYPQVDCVLRGDSIEDSLLQLMECLSLGRVVDLVPGLTWRTQLGHVIENPVGPPPDTLDDLVFGYEQRGRTYFERGSRLAELVYGGDGGWASTCQRNYSAAVAIMARGCAKNCPTCGSSAYAYQRLHGRKAPIYRSPERLALDLHEIRRSDTGPVSIPGDITQAGMDYAYRFLRAIRGFQSLVFLDLFQPVPRKFLQDVADALPHFALRFSMDSHDTRVRESMGKSYSNDSIEQTAADALSLGCERLDMNFSIGLPEQDYNSVMETVGYCGYLMDRFNGDGRLQPFIAPIAPFVDPGSLAFEEPEQVGYRLRFRSLEEHRRALLAPTWKHVLNYETEWMTRDDIVRATHDATVAMAWLRANHGIIPADYAQKIEGQVDETRGLMDEIDRALAADDVDQLQDALRGLKPGIDEANRVGLWHSRLVRRPAGPKRGYTWRGARGVWRCVKDWWRGR